MDKNIENDLSDIMKEIEALEQDFKNEEKAFAKSAVIQELAQLSEQLSAPVGQKQNDQPFDWLQGDNNQEKPLDASEADIFEMKAQEPAAPIEHHTATVSSITAAPKAQPKEWKEKPAASSAKMTFNLPEGKSVQMEFIRGEECMIFSWTEEGFHVEVEGGMSFTIPLSQFTKAA